MKILGQPKSTISDANRIVIGALVEYEQHGNPILAAVLAEKKGKWLLVNEAGAQLELPADRLFLLPGKVPDTATTADLKAKFLKETKSQAEERAATAELEEAWALFLDSRKEISPKDISELCFGDTALLSQLAARRLLLSDTVYFKRKKNLFEPRPAETVQELKHQREIERERDRRSLVLITALAERLRGKEVALPDTVVELAKYAALGKSFTGSKDCQQIIDEALRLSNVALKEHGADKAFSALVRARYFSPDEHLALLRYDRTVGFPDSILTEASAIATRINGGPDGGEDFSSVEACTIDNESTRDFDDALSFERTESGGVRIGIFISDVARAVPPDSVLDREAFRRATTVYCPDVTIPMLPPSLSESALSLVAGALRPVFGFFFEFSADLDLRVSRLARGWLRVKQRLSYKNADALLCDGAGASTGDLPQVSEAECVRLREKLLGLWDVASKLESERLGKGAWQFSRRELYPKILDGGVVELEEAQEDTPAHRLVSEFMILANVTAAQVGAREGIPLIYRSQEAPTVVIDEQGLEIPEGSARDFFRRSFVKKSLISQRPAPHAGLGVPAYCQITSPIRRMADLVNQRQLGAYLDGRPYASEEEVLGAISALEVSLDESITIQRERTRYWLFRYLEQQRIQELDAIILKVDGPKPLAEIPLLGMIQPFHMKDSGGRDRRGEHIRLHVESLHPRHDTLVLRER